MTFNLDEAFGPVGSLARICNEELLGIELTQRVFEEYGTSIGDEATRAYSRYTVAEVVMPTQEFCLEYERTMSFGACVTSSGDTERLRREGGQPMVDMLQARLAMSTGVGEADVMFFHLGDVVYFLSNDGEGGPFVSAYRVSPTPPAV